MGTGQGWCRTDFVEASDPFSPKKGVYSPAEGICNAYSFSSEMRNIPEEFIYDPDTKLVGP